MSASMTPERWQQVKSMFHRAREVAPEERSSFLDHACSGDHSLRREVESLLSSDEEVRTAFLDAETTQATLAEGTKVGDYEVRSLLGSGGMGVVYRARDSRLGRDVAIKVLPPFFASDQNRLRRFEQEARAAAALNHPNILAVYQLGTYESSPYLVSELLQGETLRARLKCGPIPLGEALEYAQQIARGLAEAHEKGIVHRDLKPENLFLTKDGQIKILDFGLAKQTRPEPAETRSAVPATEAGVVMGTMGYMSPEQVRGQKADFRSDIFAFGAILYEMLSGRRAFTGESSADVASAILKENPPRLSRSITNLPKALESTIDCCLEKTTQQRFQSTQELLATLRGIEVLPPRGVSIAHAWLRVLCRWQLAAGLVAALVVVAAVFSNIRNFHNQETIDSIAVMPFASRSADSSNDTGDTITAGLIDSLSQIPNLRVMSHSAVSHYKGQQADPRNVGRELNVRAVLLGTLVPRDNGFVIEAELVNTSDGRHIWSHQYDANPGEILTVQEDLARTVSDKLRPRLSAEAKARLSKSGTVSPEAYSLYVKGRYSVDQWNEQHMKEALAYFQQAVEKDPAYAPAYAGMGNAYAGLDFFRLLPRQEAIQKAKAAAHRALELDPNLAEAHCALGFASYLAWEWEESERESRRCAESNPNLFFAHTWYAWILVTLRKKEQGLAEMKRAFELDPVSFTSNKFLAEAYYNARDYDHTIEQLQKMVELQPNRPDLYDRLGDSYFLKGEYDKAAAVYEVQFRVSGKDKQADLLHRAYAKDGFRGLLKTQIQFWSNSESPDDYDPYDIAGNYSMLGDRGNAFLWLDKAYAEKDKLAGGNLLEIQVQPFFDNIRSDSRYEALRQRMGFPQ